MKHFDSQALARVMSKHLNELRVDPEQSKNLVASLIQTSLRGVDSHGINLFPHYCRAVSVDRINPRPNMTFHDNGPSASVLDADHAFGHHSGAVAMDHVNKQPKDGYSLYGISSAISTFPATLMPIFGCGTLSWPVMRMPFSSSTIPSVSLATLKSGGRL